MYLIQVKGWLAALCALMLVAGCASVFQKEEPTLPQMKSATNQGQNKKSPSLATGAWKDP